jgi:hypothetical protein
VHWSAGPSVLLYDTAQPLKAAWIPLILAVLFGATADG